MAFLDWLKVLFLGIVEGVTEWLPISSTGHMILVDEFWKTENHSVLTAEFMEMFTVVIQLGAILAVVWLYFPKLWPFHCKRKRAYFAKRSSRRILRAGQELCENYVDMDKIILWLKIALSCLPAMLIGLPLDDWMDALLIGLFQVLSLIPGTSRSGATILGGILIGTSRGLAAEYTFFLAIPVMFGASALKLLKFGAAFTGTQLAVLLLGMISAFVVSVLAIKFLVGYIRKHDFSGFGWYRIALGILSLLVFFL